MTDLYIVRHGNTFDKGDTVTRVGARTDLPLSQSGLEQAAQLSEDFQHVAPDGFARAYCSPLLRTRQTADAILAGRDDAPDLETLEFLREVDYGPDENQPEETVIARIGADALQAWDEAAIPPPGWDLDPEKLRAAWRDLFVQLAAADLSRPVLIVTSNGIARFALDAVTAFNVQPDSIKLKTGAYGRLSLVGPRITLESWNVRP
ncbi:MAG: histidine phosphatase family protein [Hyphomonadaceae bacterium]|nr:histidine phosphatase family protein [Hyphomonadaceae bacterium]